MGTAPAALFGRAARQVRHGGDDISAIERALSPKPAGRDKLATTVLVRMIQQWAIRMYIFLYESALRARETGQQINFWLLT